ncbi:isocitrate lyase/PEP mutase family protein [Kribbella jiaozuonensis]|uniref:Isocitrate lyase/phosphoenolpyruvate mutase family protein n=1 Tax=Kribbella jiaozuonensis TaxID=2575441 RepID=A0A4U3LF03_9ACTN|nr:isocitrate lyase/phosphoenolpyruvate mutase family protein [Kribbella jiaozuonensis]TKK72868.1 isocitrate lyase/phosphoenolpyruvate mutase family protein [Kribbella jiaozuonensis]TKK74098.1 isocitrate lyase/phosphoenolpyruvate mutase family protein [Kribbella jiaozuonensis]
MSTQNELARQLRSLHEQPPLVLPNAWDAGSARAIEAAGAKAIATTSAGVAWAHGVDDAGGLDQSSAVVALRLICAAVSVPVTADIEAGYGDVAGTVAGVLEAGVVGVNLEDSTGRVVDDALVHVERIKAARAAAVAAGIELVINARTDTYLFGDKTGTLERAKMYADAGADVLFVPGVVDAATIAELVEGSPLPLNVMVGPGAPSVGELAKLGVARISVGPAITGAAYALATAAAKELLNAGTYNSLTS